MSYTEATGNSNLFYALDDGISWDNGETHWDVSGNTIKTYWDVEAAPTYLEVSGNSSTWTEA